MSPLEEDVSCAETRLFTLLKVPQDSVAPDELRTRLFTALKPQLGVRDRDAESMLRPFKRVQPESHKLAGQNLR